VRVAERRPRLWGVAVALLAPAVVLLAPGARAAEPSRVDRAQGLFVEGRALFDAGRVDAACAALARSEALDPAVGTLGLLAACHERQGRTGTAYREYEAAADLAHARGDEREAFARARADALEPHLARLTIRAALPAPGLVVSRDGAPLAAGALGEAQIVDPGRVGVEASAPARARWSTVIVVGEGARAEVEIPPLAPSADASRVAASSATEAPRSAWLGPRRLVAIASTGVGLAAIGIGTAYGIAAIHHADASRIDCDADDRCGPGGGALRDRARGEATVSTLAFGVGIAGVAAGAVLVLTEPRSPRRSLALAPALGGASLVGRF
jgi:hypothetical protein